MSKGKKHSAISHSSSQFLSAVTLLPVTSGKRRRPSWLKHVQLRGATGNAAEVSEDQQESGLGWRGGVGSHQRGPGNKSWNLPLGGGEGEKKRGLSCVDWGTKRSEERTPGQGSERDGGARGPWPMSQGHEEEEAEQRDCVRNSEKKRPGNTL